MSIISYHNRTLKFGEKLYNGYNEYVFINEILMLRKVWVLCIALCYAFVSSTVAHSFCIETNEDSCGHNCCEMMTNSDASTNSPKPCLQHCIWNYKDTVLVSVSEIKKKKIIDNKWVDNQWYIPPGIIEISEWWVVNVSDFQYSGIDVAPRTDEYIGITKKIE